MACPKSNDSLLSFEMIFIANGKTSALYVTHELVWRLHRLEYSEARFYNV